MSTNNEALKAIFKNWADDYNQTCSESRDAYIKTLAPGATMPPAGTIYGAANKEAFSNRCTEYRAKAAEILNNEITKANAAISKEPTAEAVNMCQLLQMRKSTNPDEYNTLLEKYSDTPAVYETVRSIAHENGIKGIPAHPATMRKADLEEYRSRIYQRITPMYAKDGHTSDGYMAIFNDEIDSLFSE